MYFGALMSLNFLLGKAGTLTRMFLEVLTGFIQNLMGMKEKVSGSFKELENLCTFLVLTRMVWLSVLFY